MLPSRLGRRYLVLEKGTLHDVLPRQAFLSILPADKRVENGRREVGTRVILARIVVFDWGWCTLGAVEHNQVLLLGCLHILEPSTDPVVYRPDMVRSLLDVFMTLTSQHTDLTSVGILDQVLIECND